MKTFDDLLNDSKDDKALAKLKKSMLKNPLFGAFCMDMSEIGDDITLDTYKKEDKTWMLLFDLYLKGVRTGVVRAMARIVERCDRISNDADDDDWKSLDKHEEE